jgi:uncharacterized membrane protein YbhN (UPF0104 family)
MQLRKFASTFIKLLIIALSLWFIYDKVFRNEHIGDMHAWFMTTLSTQNKWPLLLVVVLMFVNWGLDAVKWQYLIQKLEKVSLWLSIKAVFLGITVSIFTPNRIGEFGGRVFCLQQADRMKAVLVTVMGNLGQLLVTVVFGLLAGLSFLHNYYKADMSGGLFFLLVVLSAVAITSFLALFLNTSIWSSFLNRFGLLRKFKEYNDVFAYYQPMEMLNVFLLSAARYLVFTIQFYLLMTFFQVELTVLESATMSALTFLSMSIIPTIALTEIGVRGSVAIYFFGLLSTNSLGIMTAAFTLWAVNLVLPALLGTVLVYNLKFFRS